MTFLRRRRESGSAEGGYSAGDWIRSMAGTRASLEMIRTLMERRMINLLLLLALASLVLFPSSSSAAKFDMWETGMDINEIVNVARKHNIPIPRTNIVHGYSKFDQKLLDDQFFKASALEYGTNPTHGVGPRQVSDDLSSLEKALKELLHLG